MIHKIVQSMAEAMAGIRDGSVVLLGGVTKWLDWSKIWKTFVTPLSGKLS